MDPTPGTEAWYAQVTEDIIEPERPIIDCHHHLFYGWFWMGRHRPDYSLEDLWRDTGSGHKIEKTVFAECGTGYRTAGPDHLKPVGETEYVAGIAAQSARAGPGKAVIAGIVSYADVTLGDALDELLDAHETAGKGLLRGIRDAPMRQRRSGIPLPTGVPWPRLYLDEAFQAGVRRIGQRGYTFEAYHNHTYLRDFSALAKAAAGTTIILDHVGTPLGTGPFQGQREAVFQQWRADIALLAECPNVYVKLGGLAMPGIGFGWHAAAKPATSDELVAAQKRYYLHTIECFGAHRCMFESNFPMDKVSVSYAVLWNALKKMVADFSEDEKHALFYGTAARVYRL